MNRKITKIDWTEDLVASRFHSAAMTAMRLPKVGPYGYPNPWGMLGLPVLDKFPDPMRAYRRIPPSPKDIAEMLETMQWVQFLDIPSRQLIWMRANRFEWQQIGRRLACDRNTASRRWHRCIEHLTKVLNGQSGSAP